MTLQQIIYVLKIAEVGSMNRAASELFVAQPTLTNAVKELEKEIKLQLFIRTSKGVQPTEEGRRFLEDARSMYSQYLLLTDKYNNTYQKKRFSVSTQHFSFAVKCFVNMVNRLNMETYKLAIRETKTMNVIKDVGSGISDIGIIYLSSYNSKFMNSLFEEYNLEFHPVFNCDACVYVHRNHPLANYREIGLEDLKDYPCLSFEQDEANSYFLAEEILTDNEFERSIKATDRSTMLNLMIGLNGYTLCPGIVCEELNGDSCRVIPYKEDVNNPNRNMQIGYIVKKHTIINDALEMYINELTNYVNKEK